MIRWFHRFVLASALLCSVGAYAQPSAVVFMYHRFGEARYPSTNVDLDVFEAHLDHLASNGYRVLPLGEILDAVRDGTDLPNRAVAITVDDAYRSVYEHGFPRLRARGLAFTVFVATDPVDRGHGDYLTWDQMREMAAAGVTFANHSATHDHLVERRPGEGGEAWGRRVQGDILRAQGRLTAELGQVPPWFVYPYGEYDEALADRVSSLGFTAFGQQSGPIGPHSDPRALPRFPMGGPYTDIEQFRMKAATLPFPMVAIQPWDPVTESRRPVLEVTIGPGGARLDEIACFVSGQGQVPVEWVEPGRQLRVRAKADLAPGRNRYNLTAPNQDRTRYHWFSHPWIVRP